MSSRSSGPWRRAGSAGGQGADQAAEESLDLGHRRPLGSVTVWQVTEGPPAVSTVRGITGPGPAESSPLPRLSPPARRTPSPDRTRRTVPSPARSRATRRSPRAPRPRCSAAPSPPDRETVGVLVLRMPGMTSKPGPLHVVLRLRRPQALPELQVLDRAALPGPAPRSPGVHPLADTPHQVLGVGDHQRLEPRALPAQDLERPGRPHERHPVVGRGGLVQVEVAPLDSATRTRADFDEPGAASRVLSLPTVAQAALVQMQHGDRLGQSIT